MPKFPGGGGVGGSGVGDVTGPASSTDNAIATFDGTTGKVIQDSGVLVETAPAGGSGFTVVEYASAPVAPASGFMWIERVNATTVKWSYFDGTDTYSVEMTT